MVRPLKATKEDIDLPSRVGHLNVCFGGLRTYRLMATSGAKQTKKSQTCAIAPAKPYSWLSMSLRATPPLRRDDREGGFRFRGVEGRHEGAQRIRFAIDFHHPAQHKARRAGARE
ncbi:hypothetical protein MCEMIH15_01194 [Caulobacteraceae bacterium]